MYSTQEMIHLAATRGKLNQLFTEMMSDIEQKFVTIQNVSDIKLNKILEQLDEKDLLVTNDDYINEKCDFQVLDSSGKILLTVNEDGSTVNDLSQDEYLEESACEYISEIFDRIMHSNHICMVTTSAA